MHEHPVVSPPSSSSRLGDSAEGRPKAEKMAEPGMETKANVEENIRHQLAPVQSRDMDESM